MQAVAHSLLQSLAILIHRHPPSTPMLSAVNPTIIVAHVIAHIITTLLLAIIHC